MAACTEHKETLMLDVYGELASADRLEWEEHLAACKDCRQEKERLSALIQRAKQGLCVPPLTSQEEHFLSSSVQRRLRTGRPDAAPKRLGWRIAPALGACLIVVFAGLFGLQNFKSPDTVAINGTGPEDQVMNGNEELFENMELLEEMEVLEQLVNLLDEQSMETTMLESGGGGNDVRAHV